MTDPRRSDSSSDPTDAYPNPYPAYSDPAYAGNYPYGPSYSAPVGPPPGVSASRAAVAVLDAHLRSAVTRAS